VVRPVFHYLRCAGLGHPARRAFNSMVLCRRSHVGNPNWQSNHGLIPLFHETQLHQHDDVLLRDRNCSQ
jgi:hypothetical protein